MQDSRWHRGWRGVNKQEELLAGGGEEAGDAGAEGSSEQGGGGQAATSRTPDADGTGSSSLPEPGAPWHL